MNLSVLVVCPHIVDGVGGDQLLSNERLLVFNVFTKPYADLRELYEKLKEAASFRLKFDLENKMLQRFISNASALYFIVASYDNDFQ